MKNGTCPKCNSINVFKRTLIPPLDVYGVIAPFLPNGFRESRGKTIIVLPIYFNHDY